MYNYNILRTEKVKSRSQITEAAMHNFRNREQHNIDGTQSHKNEILVNTLGVDTKNRVHYRRSFQHTMQPLGLKRKK